MSKYKAICVTVDGIRFASKKEAERYRQLKKLLDQGKIKGLKTQPRYPIYINGKKVFAYVADFAYYCHERGDYIVEDVKSTYTAKLALYRLKKKCVEAQYNIKIVEVLE